MAEAPASAWDASRWFQVGGLAAMAVGLVLAWAKAGPFSVTGLDTDDGKLFGGILVLAGLVVLAHEQWRGRWWMAAAAAGVALLIFAVYEIGHVYDSNNDDGSKDPNTLSFDLDVSPGAGLWIDALGAAALTFGAATATKGRASKSDESN